MEKTPIEQVEGAYLLKFKRFSDDRGYFQEVQSAAKSDLLKYVWQINVSSSNANVVRGMQAILVFGGNVGDVLWCNFWNDDRKCRHHHHEHHVLFLHLRVYLKWGLPEK